MNGTADRNPPHPTKLPTSAYFVVKQYISPADAGKLCAAMPEPFALMAALIYATGIRVDEAVAIESEDFDVVGRRIHIRGNGPRDRFVQVAESLIPALRASLPAPFETETLLFRRRSGRSSGGPLCTRQLYAHLEAARIATGLPGTVENLRGSFALNLHDSGIRTKLIRRAMGVKSAGPCLTLNQFRGLLRRDG